MCRRRNGGQGIVRNEQSRFSSGLTYSGWNRQNFTEEVLFNPHPKAKSVRGEGWQRRGKNLKYKNPTWPGRPLLINMPIFSPCVHNGSGFLCLSAKNIVLVCTKMYSVYLCNKIYREKYITGHHTWSSSTGEAKAGALLGVWGQLELQSETLFHKGRDGRRREGRKSLYHHKTSKNVCKLSSHPPKPPLRTS